MQLSRLAPPGSTDLSGGAVLKILHDGVPGDVLASGFAFDPRNGSSTGFDFHDPTSAVSSRRAAAGIRLGAAGADGGFPPETRFSAPLLLANVSDADLSVELALGASADGALRVAEETVTLQAGEIRTVELSGLLERAGLRGSPAAGLDLAFDGEPSALLARLSVVDSSGYYAFDVPLTDSQGSTGTGNDAYAWRIDRDHSSFVYLKNVLDEPVNALVQVRFEGGTYNPDRIRLEPFETVVVDLEEMRASGEPDIRGNPFPPGAEAGQIEWHEETPESLVGRGEIFDRATGSAASYACQSNCCGLVRDSGEMSPSSAVDVVGAAGQIFTPLEGRKNPCTGALFGPYDMTGDSFFSSSDASIATAGSGGWINCIAPGSAGISAQHDSIVGYGQGCVTIVAAITVGSTLNVNPQVSIESFEGIPRDATKTVQVTVNPSPSSVNVTLELSTLSGSGSARFAANDSTSLVISGTSNVEIKGITQSSTANNIRLQARGTGATILATQNFSVVWVTLALRTSGNVSDDNAAKQTYLLVLGTTGLGTFKSSGTGAQIWRNGVEIVGTVNPPNFLGNIILDREVVAFNEYLNSTTPTASGGPFPDTSEVVLRDDDPQSGGSSGKVYDLDAPGHNVPGTTDGDFRRFRINFRQWATFKGIKASADLNWFSRLSVLETVNGEVLKTDVTGDNQAGVGTTNLTWNLQ